MPKVKVKVKQKEPEKFIAKVVEPHEVGALHRQLGIPVKQRIPKTLLQKIHGSGEGAKARKVGKTIKNPTKTGKKRYKVTPLMWQRSHFALAIGYGKYPRKK